MDINAAKSKNDLKEYRLLTLPSGLEVLLVSTEELLKSTGQTEESGKAAASMCVNSGSFCDPSDAEGLAHFLEHMVFMGSAKYPSENQYDSYISSHGGSCNAFTEGEYTVYQFDVFDEHLKTSLDMFASCFISPLFKKNAVDRELKAIQSEFDLACTNDDARVLQLLSSLSEEGHILRKFSWGNMNSLETIPKERGVDMNVMLRSFHRAHYQPSNSKLVLVAPRSLDKLESLVNACFDGWSSSSGEQNDAIAWLLANEDDDKAGKPGKKGSQKKGKKSMSDNKVKGKQQKKQKTDKESTFTVDMPSLTDILAEQTFRFKTPLNKKESGMLTRMVPIKATHRLVMVWQMPPTQKKYRTKNEQYLCHLLGHECRGSLISHLKDLGLATFIEAGCDGSNLECNSLFTLLQVTVVLTAKGLANWVQVVTAVVQYLTLMKREGPQEWIFRELQRIAQLEYDFLDESGEEELAERLAQEMSPLLARSREDLLPGSFLLWEWDPAGVSAMMDEMAPENMNIVLLSASYGVPGTTDVLKGKSQVSDDNDADEEGEDWSTDEGDSSEEGEDEGEDGKGKGKDGNSEEVPALSPSELKEMFIGPAEWLGVVLPPAYDPDHTTEVNLSGLKTEKHFGTYYWRDPLPTSIRDVWTEAWLATESPASMNLPQVNPYLPENLILVPCEVHPPPPPEEKKNDTKKDKLILEPEPIPQRIIDEPGLRVWHIVEPRFAVPKVGMYVRLASPVASSSARNSAMNDLLRLVLYDSLEKEVYMASMAELTTSLGSNDLGLEIKLKGFSDKAPKLMKTVLSTLASPEEFVTEASFCMQTEKLIRMYRNDGLKSSSTASNTRLVSLKSTTHASRCKSRYLKLPSTLTETSAGVRSEAELIDEDVITSACLVKYVQEFLAHLSVEILSHGNFSKEAMHALCDEMLPKSKFHLDASAHIDQRIVKLPREITTIMRQEPRNPAEPSICVEMYYQFGPQNIANAVKLDLLEQILYEPFFDQLRTKQQLGYSVSSSGRCTFGVLGFLFSVVSSAYNVAEVQRAILAFVAGIPRLILTLKKDEYFDHIDSLVNEKTRPPLNIFEAFNNNTYCIVDRRYDFDTRMEEAQLLKSQSRENLSSFAQQLFGITTRRLMSIQVSHEGADAPLEDVSTEKQKNATCPDDIRSSSADLWDSVC